MGAGRPIRRPLEQGGSNGGGLEQGGSSGGEIGTCFANGLNMVGQRKRQIKRKPKCLS